MQTFDITNMTPEGIALLLGEDGTVDEQALKGMPGNALAAIIKRTKAPSYWADMVTKAWRKANRVDYSLVYRALDALKMRRPGNRPADWREFSKLPSMIGDFCRDNGRPYLERRDLLDAQFS